VTWEDSAAATRARVTEEMVSPLLGGEAFGSSLDVALAGKRAIVVGPGFGTGDVARAAVTALLSRWKGPALYDADALTLFAGNPEAFAQTEVPCILSPHGGEAARLLSTTADAIEADRFGAAKALATRARAVVILKGAYTLVAPPDGTPVAVNPSACPALATAGSGDTLAGIVGAMLCGLSPFDAACAGVFIHAAAAEAWSAKHGDRGLLASEIADGVPDVIAALTREHTRGPG
jgi:NAD(P)H-hydrate epimerase